MKVTDVKFIGSWADVKEFTLNTVGKKPSSDNISPEWKRKILLCEHSPIRALVIKWKWENIKYWVSVHFVRHKIGIEHFIKTSRTDRTGINRNELPQSNDVDHMCKANAQAMINISRKRLCKQASMETRDAWKEVLLSIKDKEPELYDVCVPECVYRGWCYEFKSCGYHKTPHFQETLEKYRNKINI